MQPDWCPNGGWRRTSHGMPISAKHFEEVQLIGGGRPAVGTEKTRRCKKYG